MLDHDVWRSSRIYPISAEASRPGLFLDLTVHIGLGAAVYFFNSILVAERPWWKWLERWAIGIVLIHSGIGSCGFNSYGKGMEGSWTHHGLAAIGAYLSEKRL